MRYIGQTQQKLTVRVTNHRCQARFGTDQPVYRWIRKHGPDNIRAKVLQEVNEEGNLDEAEREWISKAGLNNLLNVAVGGVDGTTLGRKRPGQSLRMRGEGHPASRITEGDVRYMRDSYTRERGQVTEFSKRYGITVTAVMDVISGRSWPHLPLGKIVPKKRRPKLTEDEVRSIRERYARGETMTSIAKDFEQTITNVSYIVNRKTWTHVQ